MLHPFLICIKRLVIVASFELLFYVTTGNLSFKLLVCLSIEVWAPCFRHASEMHENNSFLRNEGKELSTKCHDIITVKVCE